MNDNTQLFDDFLENRLTAEQREEFLKRIKDDETFRKDFENHELAIEVITASMAVSIRKRIQKIQNSPKKGKVISMNLRVIYAAAILVAIFGVALVWQVMGPKNPSEVYAEYHEVAEGPSFTRSSDSPSAWEQFIEKYQASEFEESLIELHEAELDGKEPVYLIRYYQGVCMMNTEVPDFTAAIDRFEQVLAGDNDYHGPSLWHIGLCQLKLEQIEEAIKTFEFVKENFPDQSEMAKSILSEL